MQISRSPSRTQQRFSTAGLLAYSSDLAYRSGCREGIRTPDGTASVQIQATGLLWTPELVICARHPRYGRRTSLQWQNTVRDIPRAQGTSTTMSTSQRGAFKKLQEAAVDSKQRIGFGG